MGAGGDFLAPPGRQRVLGHDRAHRLDAAHHAFHIVRMLQEARVDQRRAARVRIAQTDGAAALRAQNADMAGVTVAHAEHPVQTVVVEFGGGQMQLQVRALLLRPRFNKAAGLRHVGGQLATAFGEEIPHRLGAGERQLPGAHGEGVAAPVAVDHQHVRVVLQVAADAGQLVHRVDTVAFQFLRIADPGQLQQLRRVDGAAGQDHLAGLDGVHAALVLHLHTGGAFAVEADPVHQGPGHHRQVVPFHGRVQIAAGHAPAFAVLLVDLVHRHPFLGVVVEVIGGRVAGLDPGGHERLADRVAEFQLGDVEVAVNAVERALAAGLVVFTTLEQRQHVFIAPAGVTQRLPVVVIPGVATGVAHGVHRRGAAQGLAAGNIDFTVIKGFLRYRVIAPVAGVGAHQPDDPGGDANKQAVVRGARFQQTNTGIGVLGQPVGQDATGGAGAHDHIIKLHAARLCSMPISATIQPVARSCY